MELVLKIEGNVQESNLEAFKADAMQIVEGIPTELVTDMDFGNAEQDVKLCKQVENRIWQAKQDALQSIEDVSLLFNTMDELSEQFRQTRLDLEKKIKTEKAARRQEIVDHGKKHMDDMIISASAGHLFSYGTAFQDAIKGKKSLDKMMEAVNEVLGEKGLELARLNELYEANLALIAEAEEDYPGLFSDKHTLCGKPTIEIVDLIKQRIEHHKLKVAERERQKEQQNSVVVEETPTFSVQPIRTEPINPVDDQVRRYTLTVNAIGTRTAIEELAKQIETVFPAVESVEV